MHAQRDPFFWLYVLLIVGFVLVLANLPVIIDFLLAWKGY